MRCFGLWFILLGFLSSCNNNSETNEFKNEPELNSVVSEHPTAEPNHETSQIPAWAISKFETGKLSKLYQISEFSKPNFIKGNFNTDSLSDVAILIANLKTQEKGVAIIHQGKEDSYFVFGAGKEISGMKNLDWIEVFEKIPKGETVAETLVDEESGDIIGPDTLNLVKLKTDGIFLHVEESEGGGIIYWDNNKYTWLHNE